MRLPEAQIFAKQLAQQIVRAGGSLMPDHKGRLIFPGRIDVGFSVSVFDPVTARDVQCVVRMRCTVRPLDLDMPEPAGVITGIEVIEG